MYSTAAVVVLDQRRWQNDFCAQVVVFLCKTSGAEATVSAFPALSAFHIALSPENLPIFGKVGVDPDKCIDQCRGTCPQNFSTSPIFVFLSHTIRQYSIQQCQRHENHL